MLISFYEDYITFTDDIVSQVGKELEPKKPNEVLVRTLSQKINPHFLFVIDQVHKKLISLSSTNEPARETVPQSAATDSDISSNAETQISMGNEISEGLSDS